MAQEQVEEYLEAIYDIAGTEGAAKTTAIAKCLKVAPGKCDRSAPEPCREEPGELRTVPGRKPDR